MSEAQKEDAGKPSSGQAGNLKDFSALFASYGKFGDSKGKGKISVRNIQKWFQQAEKAKLKDEINDEYIAEEYKKLFQEKTHITQAEFDSLLGTIAESKKLDKKVLLDKLVSAGEPKTANLQDVIMGAEKNLALKDFVKKSTEEEEQIKWWKDKRETIHRVMKEKFPEEERPSVSSLLESFQPLYTTLGDEEMFLARNWLFENTLPEYSNLTLAVLEFGDDKKLSLNSFLEKVPRNEKVKVALKVENKIFIEFIIKQELDDFILTKHEWLPGVKLDTF